MAERGASLQSWLRTGAARLSRHWPVLAAALVLFLFIDLSRNGNGLLAFGASLVVVIVALAAGGAAATEQRGREGTAVATSIDTLPAIHLAAAVPDPLFIIDGQGAFVYANQAAGKAFGTTAAGSSVQLKFRQPEMHAFIDRVLRGGEGALSTDYVERVPVERAYRVSATAIGEGSGLHVLLFKDQSEARRIDRMRADFIANASHELRTPLASVSGFIETLRGPARDDARARENFLQIMQDQTGRMARLIDDLLSLSRLEIKPYAKPETRVDLRVLLEGVADSLTHLASESGVEIVLDLPDRPLEVAAHRDELVQVFQNLMENACKYGSDGGKVLVTADPEAPNGETTVTVTDFGPGIPEEHIPRITERFYRVDVETSRAQKGTGLGLAIVKHILTRHDARLSVRSKVGDGSAFTVHFPPE
ncbi:ATP-binding protein [Nitratireductor thuwali]|uniref:histidine kinase n=1 Tax=Nitratireductor thuwali TaxID=2267699 RepID=A0ABY5MLN1_9HYPH|nr:Alkaline phosphatase synthesis sensor protein PhoR [Nitratireductor thuwali]